MCWENKHHRGQKSYLNQLLTPSIQKDSDLDKLVQRFTVVYWGHIDSSQRGRVLEIIKGPHTLRFVACRTALNKFLRFDLFLDTTAYWLTFYHLEFPWGGKVTVWGNIRVSTVQRAQICCCFDLLLRAGRHFGFRSMCVFRCSKPQGKRFLQKLSVNGHISCCFTFSDWNEDTALPCSWCEQLLRGSRREEKIRSRFYSMALSERTIRCRRRRKGRFFVNLVLGKIKSWLAGQCFASIKNTLFPPFRNKPCYARWIRIGHSL